MKVIKNIKNSFLIYLSYTFLSILIWSFVIVNVTTISMDKQVCIFSLADYTNTTKLEEKFEDVNIDNIEKIYVRDINYTTFEPELINYGDIYLLRESNAIQTISTFIPLNQQYISSHDKEQFYYYEGVPYGIKIYDGNTKKGIADDLIWYCSTSEGIEDYYMFFNKNSSHIGHLNNSKDDAALIVSDYFLSLRKG